MSEQPLTYDWVAGKPKAVPADKLPPKEYMKGNLHIVDLSKCVDPYTESRRCNLWRFNTGGDVPDFHTNVDIGSHLGNHCECRAAPGSVHGPRHLLRAGSARGSSDHRC